MNVASTELPSRVGPHSKPIGDLARREIPNARFRIDWPATAPGSIRFARARHGAARRIGRDGEPGYSNRFGESRRAVGCCL